MDTLIHADIFFFITTIVVVIVGIAATIALIYLSKVLNDLKEITRNVKEETELVREDIKNFREGVAEQKSRVQHLIKFITTIVGIKTAVSKSRSKGKSKS